MLKVSQGAQEAAVAIRVALYRAEPSMPSYDKDVVEPILAAFEATARKRALEEAAKVAESRHERAKLIIRDDDPEEEAFLCGLAQASRNIGVAIRALGSQNDG